MPSTSITHKPKRRPKSTRQTNKHSRTPYFLAPKLVLAFFVSLPSVSLSSAAAAAGVFFLLFLDAFALPPPPAVLAGVGAPDGPSLPLALFPKLLELGVGACEAGVEVGVCASWPQTDKQSQH
jgi:hypothetical protein